MNIIFSLVLESTTLFQLKVSTMKTTLLIATIFAVICLITAEADFINTDTSICVGLAQLTDFDRHHTNMMCAFSCGRTGPSYVGACTDDEKCLCHLTNVDIDREAYI